MGKRHQGEEHNLGLNAWSLRQTIWFNNILIDIVPLTTATCAPLAAAARSGAAPGMRATSHGRGQAKSGVCASFDRRLERKAVKVVQILLKR